jgi:RNA-binding protein Musashi
VSSVELMKDRTTGKPRGFGFVCFADPATVDLVMQEQHEVCHKVR